MKHMRMLVGIFCVCLVYLTVSQQAAAATCNGDWPEFLNTNMKRWNSCEKVLSAASVKHLGKVWSYATGSQLYSSPAVANGVMYIGSGDGNVYALDVSNGIVYVGSWDGKVYALNAKTGVKLWSFTTGYGVWSSPAVSKGVVYVGSGDGNVYALNAKTGVKLWSYTTGGEARSSPAAANGIVYVGSFDGNVYALNAS